jgi:ribose 5-phosphate isomerase A
VLEVLPQARSFVMMKLVSIYKDITMEYRQSATGTCMLTKNCNLLLDVWFTTWPAPVQLNTTLKTITGVVETSLFYYLSTKAITASEAGIKIFTKV